MAGRGFAARPADRACPAPSLRPVHCDCSPRSALLRSSTCLMKVGTTGANSGESRWRMSSAASAASRRSGGDGSAREKLSRKANTLSLPTSRRAKSAVGVEVTLEKLHNWFGSAWVADLAEGNQDLPFDRRVDLAEEQLLD